LGKLYTRKHEKLATLRGKKAIARRELITMEIFKRAGKRVQVKRSAQRTAGEKTEKRESLNHHLYFAARIIGNKKEDKTGRI